MFYIRDYFMNKLFIGYNYNPVKVCKPEKIVDKHLVWKNKLFLL